MNSQYIKRAENCLNDEMEAVKELADQLYQEDLAGVIFFCSIGYDLGKIKDAVAKYFDCPVTGCTTAGEIGTRYQKNGIVGISFSSRKFAFHCAGIDDLNNFNLNEAKDLIEDMKKNLKFSSVLDPAKIFTILLIDGLSVKEEEITSSLYRALEGISLIGGSAADNLTFTRTFVFAENEFRTGVASFVLIESKMSFKAYKMQHYQPSDKDMVITEADAAKRIVTEINGGPAAEELAEIIGIPKDELTLEVYSTHPVMLQIGDEWYVRSIQYVNEDDSLTFACAIDSGIPLTVGEGTGLLPSLKKQIDQIRSDFSHIEATIGFDCIHRRLEIFAKGLVDEVENELGKIKFIGFSTYGEQFNSIHVNQTLTCVVIGKP
ncbi:conserved hypothetical protein [Desulfamplus magnetovallimortis]|uniref:Uncharacterized protein n=1 Tax=Desulfamplus magnetovallimortis TaxID=1246637 RepID=A0A1W1H6J5_9BACT|nr:FIST N-terminal domain-containing protein [Desulfamplus magnetovallimortis]SLM27988.1 conserved hypothetical protein [Desulfamplus magnetovallimortis]